MLPADGRSSQSRFSLDQGLFSLRRITAFVLALACANIVVLALLSSTRPGVKPFIFDRPLKLLVLAAHQDDCVIQAGGLTIKNSRLGGETIIAYLTRPSDDDEATIRREEAIDAWSLLSNPPELRFLDFPSYRPWKPLQIHSARRALDALILETKPDLIVAPLQEGGHYEHDLLARLSVELKVRHPEAKIIHATEYNPYFSAYDAPERLLALLKRLLPVVTFTSSPAGLVRENQQQLAMTDEELQLKRRLLLAFHSQVEVIPLEEFGFADRFETTSAPPEGVVVVRGKTLTPWSVISLLLVFVSFALVGASIASSVMPHLAALVTGSLLLAAAWHISISPNTLLEDYVYIIALLSGGLGNVLGRALRSVLGMFSVKPPIFVDDAPAEPRPADIVGAPSY